MKNPTGIEANSRINANTAPKSNIDAINNKVKPTCFKNNFGLVNGV